MEKEISLSKRLESRHSDAFFSTKYFEGWQNTTTAVRECNLFMDEYEFNMLKVGDAVMIAHSPIFDFPEQTKVFHNEKQIGFIVQPFARDLTGKFGKYFKFYGEILSISAKISPVNQKKYFNISITFDVPFV